MVLVGKRVLFKKSQEARGCDERPGKTGKRSCGGGGGLLAWTVQPLPRFVRDRGPAGVFGAGLSALLDGREKKNITLDWGCGAC